MYSIIGQNVPGSQLYGAIIFVAGITVVIAFLEFLVADFIRKSKLIRAKEEYKSFEKTMFTAGSAQEHREKRETIMSCFLYSQGWTMGDVSQLLLSPYLSRDSDGWLIPNRCLSGKLEIKEFKGFVIDFTQRRPCIKILFKPATNGNGLLSFDDIHTFLNLNAGEAKSITFSLDPPSVKITSEPLKFHPFAAMRCKPAKLQNSDIMQTLFHADYLLKFFATGMEVSANPPFHLRPILDNLIKHLPINLLQVLQPPFARGARIFNGLIKHRFWIELKKLTYSTKASKKKNRIGYFIETINMIVKCERLLPNDTGKFCSTNSAERNEIDFVNHLTSHYDKLSEYFPILARLRELSKLQFMQNMILKELEALRHDESSKTKFRALNKEIDQLRSLFPTQLEPAACKCSLVPSAIVYCKPCNCYHEVYGGVTLKPMYEQCMSNTTTPIWSLHPIANDHQPRLSVKLRSSYKQYYSTAGGSHFETPKNECSPAAHWSDIQQGLRNRVQHLSDAFVSKSTPNNYVHIPKNESSTAAQWSAIPSGVSHEQDSNDTFTSGSMPAHSGGIRFNARSERKVKQHVVASVDSEFVWAKLGRISEYNTTKSCDYKTQCHESENDSLRTEGTNSSQTLYANKDACIIHRCIAQNTGPGVIYIITQSSKMS